MPQPHAREDAPVIELARLTLVHEADDPDGQSGAAISLDAGGVDACVAPSARDDLLLGCRSRRRCGQAAARPARASRRATGNRPARGHTSRRCARIRLCGHSVGRRSATEHQDDRHGPPCIRRRAERRQDVDGDGRIGRVVDVPDELFRDDGCVASRSGRRAQDLPLHLGQHFGSSAVNLAVEELDDLRAPLRPLRRCGYLGAAVHQERIRKVRIRIRGRLVVGRREIGAGPRWEHRDFEQIHHALTVLLVRQHDGTIRRGGSGGLLRDRNQGAVDDHESGKANQHRNRTQSGNHTLPPGNSIIDNLAAG